MSNMIKAIVVDGDHRLILADVEPPQPLATEALVRVRAISLNRGEIRRAATAPAGFRPGWDIAGVVEQPAANGSGPQAGERVVGFLRVGAWAERIAVPTNALAILPESVSFAQAASLPVAGLTALYALEKRGSLLGRNVLITGASGGVGHFAVQLAHDGGATVTALIRDENRAALVRDAGADRVVVGPDGHAAAAYAPYELIVDGVGGETLSQVMGMLDIDAMAVAYGQTAGADISFNVGRFYGTGGQTLYGFILFHEFSRESAASGLRRLLTLVDRGTLKPLISVESDWGDIAEFARKLNDRDYPGKAILHIPG